MSLALSSVRVEASGRVHADDRIQHGFTFRSVGAEFHALRATVLRLYEERASDLTDVRRFNEAIDDALTESMDRFAVSTAALTGRVGSKPVAYRLPG